MVTLKWALYRLEAFKHRCRKPEKGKEEEHWLPDIWHPGVLDWMFSGDVPITQHLRQLSGGFQGSRHVMASFLTPYVKHTIFNL